MTPRTPHPHRHAGPCFQLAGAGAGRHPAAPNRPLQSRQTTEHHPQLPRRKTVQPVLEQPRNTGLRDAKPLGSLSSRPSQPRQLVIEPLGQDQLGMKFRRIGQVQIGKHVARTTCNGRARVLDGHRHTLFCLHPVNQAQPRLDTLKPLNDAVIAHPSHGCRFHEARNMPENPRVSHRDVGNARLQFAHVRGGCDHIGAHSTKEIENTNRIFHIDILPALRAK